MFKKLLTLVLTVALSLSCMGQVKAAEEKEAYTYKVTIYAGNIGKLDVNELSVDNRNASITSSADKIEIEGLKTGDTVTVSQAIAKVSDEKYYVKGIRLSGRDSDEENITTFIDVEKDVDYVVAYGIKGNQVAYTVNYVDVDGNVLAEADTFYGNIGDKPVVAYKYIEGYVPEVYGFTKTLVDDASQNVFTFVYDEAPTPSVIIQTVPGEGTNNDDDDAQAGNAGQAGNADDAQGGSQNGQDNQEGTEQPGGDVQDDKIQDLDDEQTPGGNIDVDSSTIGMVGGIAIAVAAAVALIILILFMMKKRKEQQ